MNEDAVVYCVLIGCGAAMLMVVIYMSVCFLNILKQPNKEETTKGEANGTTTNDS